MGERLGVRGRFWRVLNSLFAAIQATKYRGWRGAVGDAL